MKDVKRLPRQTECRRRRYLSRVIKRKHFEGVTCMLRLR